MTTSFSRASKAEARGPGDVFERGAAEVGRKVCAASRGNNYVWPGTARRPHANTVRTAAELGSSSGNRYLADAIHIQIHREAGQDELHIGRRIMGIEAHDLTVKGAIIRRVAPARDCLLCIRINTGGDELGTSPDTAVCMVKGDLARLCVASHQDVDLRGRAG